MKVRQPSAFDLLADEKLVRRFYELLASVDDEELREIFHDFMVPANDSDRPRAAQNKHKENQSRSKSGATT